MFRVKAMLSELRVIDDREINLQTWATGGSPWALLTLARRARPMVATFIVWARRGVHGAQGAAQ